MQRRFLIFSMIMLSFDVGLRAGTATGWLRQSSRPLLVWCKINLHSLAPLGVYSMLQIR